METAAITVRWKIDDVRAKMEKDSDEMTKDDSEKHDQFELYLHALPTSEELLQTQVFGAGFSESTTFVKFGDLEKAKQADHDRQVSGSDDDSTEWLYEQSGADAEPDSSIDEDIPPAEVATEEAIRAESSTEAISGTEAEVTVGDHKSMEDEMEGDQPRAGREVALSILLMLQVLTCRWTTYRALIYWMYTHKLCLTGLHSNYLVYLASHDAATDPTNTSKDIDGSIDVSMSAEAIPSRRAWLVAQAEKAGRFSTDEELEPASPHAVYRLADKLDVPDVKELAKVAILEGFTVENVLYELISTFSHHYAEMQEAALAFCLAHWEEVKLTPAFERVVAGHARIEGASEILMKLMLKLSVSATPAAVSTPTPA
ncbi:hypothetical protein JCM5353_007427 [Sporobolomyces roseus]